MASKIKVDTIENVAGSGNVSLGSGHNLVVPGNITGQGTTTLTGDLAVDTSTLKVDAANNRVGIGIASPQLTGLHIQEPNASNAGKMRLSKATTSSADDGIGTIQFRTGNTTAAANINGRTDASGTGNGALQFMTGTSSSMSEAMRIDSSGRVTMPNQPAFAASSSSDITVTSDAIIAFDQTSINVGNHFNTSTNRFTAPVAGTYIFLCTISMRNVASTGTYVAIYFKKNNSGLAFRMRFRADNIGNEWDGTSGHAILALAANDYITLHGYNESGQFIMQGNEANFTGYLLK